MRFRLVKDKVSGTTYHWVEQRSFSTLFFWRKVTDYRSHETEARDEYISAIANRGTKIVLALEGSAP